MITNLLRSRILYVTIAALGFFVHTMLAVPLYSPLDRLLSWLLLVITLMVFRAYFTSSMGVLPIVPLIAIQQYLMYGVAVLSEDHINLVYGPYVPSQYALTAALSMSLMSSVAMFATISVVSRRVAKARHTIGDVLPRFRDDWWRPLILYSAVSLIVAYLFLLRPDFIPLDYRNVIRRLFSPYLALAILLCISIRSQRRFYSLLATFYLAALAALGFVQGMMEPIIVPFYVAAVAGWTWGRGVKVRWIVVALIVFAILNPVKLIYRNLAWYDTDIRSTDQVVERLQFWRLAFEKFLQNPFVTEEAVEKTASRLSGLLYFAEGVDLVPNAIPYKHADGLQSSIFYFIPRLLWPSKPLNTYLHDRYAVEFGITTAAGVTRSTFGATLTLEAYWDFGVVGVLLYSLVFGCIIGWLVGESRRSMTSALVVLAFSAESFQMLYALSSLVQSTLTLLVGASLACYAFNWLSRIATSRSGAQAPMPDAGNALSTSRRTARVT